MPKMPDNFTWTQELADAVRAVAKDNTPSPYGWDDSDRKARATEFVNQCYVGLVLKPFQVEYLICLIQRLDCGGAERESHKALKAAYAEAFEATRPAEVRAALAFIKAYHDELNRDDDDRGSICPNGDDFNDLTSALERILRGGRVDFPILTSAGR